MTPTDLTDAQYALADDIELEVEANPGRTWSPSEMARKVHASTAVTAVVLRWMAASRYLATSGNGAWTRYGARDRVTVGRVDTRRASLPG